MKTLLLLIISFLAFELHAQSLTSTGNQWNIKNTSLFGGLVNTYGIRIGDEVDINGIIYKHVLQNTEFPDEIWHENGAYLREDGDKVFYKAGDQPESILYDFGLQVGDIFESIFCDMKVIATEQIVLVDGSARKTLRLKASGVDVVETTWVEGLGSLEYGIISYPFICATDYSEELLCFYEQDDINYPSNTANCLVLKIQELNDLSLKVFPNPASTSFTIANEGGAFATYKIMDVTGKILRQSDLVSGANIINTNALSPGFYNLVLTNRNGVSVSKRLIIQ